MTRVYELLRKLFTILRLRGRWCLHTLLQLWRRLSSALGLHFNSPHQRVYPSEKPEILQSNIVSASRLPRYTLDEAIPLAGGTWQESSLTQTTLELDIRETPRKQSTSPFSPSGTTFVSSPISVFRGSLPLPSGCTNEHASKLKPTTPKGSRRYYARSPPPLECLKIPAGPSAVTRGRQRSLPSDWQEYVHPEGQSYFVNSCFSPHINVITEAYMYDSQLRQQVSDYAEIVLARTVSDCWHLDSISTELLIDIDEDGICSYYLLDHENAVIFWLEETNADDIGAPEASGIDHLRIHFHEQYWLHQEYFPSHRELPEKWERELVATLTHSCIDVITSSTSTSSLDRSQLETILGVMKNLKHTVESQGQRNCIIARLWNEIQSARFINYYGERYARLFRSHIVTEEEPTSIFMKIIFLLLFDAPSTHLTTLREFYVDKVLYTDGWRKFMEVLLNDWHDMILWATVLLAANMSFLAIFNSPDNILQENRAVTCSLVSTLSSTVSIVIGLLHVRKHRPRAREHAEAGNDYLLEATHPTLGMRPLAIVYSLPYAFLMWAMVTFIAAILLFVFQSGVTLTSRFFISAVAVGLGITLVWVVAYFWKDDLQLMENFRELCATLSLLSPVALVRLVSNVAPRGHNPEAANTPIVRHWLRKAAAADREDDAKKDGV